VEAVVVLVVICIFMLVLIRRGKGKNRALQQTIQTLLAKHQALQQQMAQQRQEFSTSNTYKKQINDQLLVTREYHKSLKAGQDITLDLNPDSPLERQTAAIRHALLVAEKEALNSSSDGSPNWQFLQSKFQQLIQFYVDINKKKSAPPKTIHGPENSQLATESQTELDSKVQD